MFRVDVATAKVALPTIPAAGAQGFFGDGNPATQDPPTQVPAWWLNMVQEEIRGVVLAGGLTPSKTNNGQMAAAITAILTGLGTAFGRYVTGDTAMATGNLYLVDVAAGGASINLTLPPAPAFGDRVWLMDVTGYFDRYPPLLGRNGHTIQGLAEDCSLNVAGLTFGLVYTAAGWSFF